MNSPGSQLCKDNGLVFVLACVLCVMYLCLFYLSPRVEPPGSELCKGSGFVFVFVLASVFVYVVFVFVFFFYLSPYSGNIWLRVLHGHSVYVCHLLCFVLIASLPTTEPFF